MQPTPPMMTWTSSLLPVSRKRPEIVMRVPPAFGPLDGFTASGIGSWWEKLRGSRKTAWMHAHLSVGGEINNTQLWPPKLNDMHAHFLHLPDIFMLLNTTLKKKYMYKIDHKNKDIYNCSNYIVAEYLSSFHIPDCILVLIWTKTASVCFPSFYKCNLICW